MPIYRHQCNACGVELLDLMGINDPNPDHCGSTMLRLMPRRVVGRVAPDTNGVHAGSGFASSGPVLDLPAADEVLASASAMPGSFTPPPVDPNNKLAIPWRTKPDAKDYAELDANERDGRWRDSCERLTEWRANCLEQDGISRGDALSLASQSQQQITEQSRAANERVDGLT